jgi:HAMP domain-containing protein
MADVLGYVTDILQNINDGNYNYCREALYERPWDDRTEVFQSALAKLLDRQTNLENEVNKYQGLLRENDSVVIISDKPSSFSVALNKNGIHSPSTASDSDSVELVDDEKSSDNSDVPLPNRPHFLRTYTPTKPPQTQSAVEHNERVCLTCLQECTEVAMAVTRGDFGRRIECPYTSGHMHVLKDTMNEMVDKIDQLFQEFTRVAREVGDEGKLGVQASIDNTEGAWQEFVVNLNMMASNHTEQVRDIADVCTAVASGDLSKKIVVEVKGETLVLKNTINTMGTSSLSI